MGRTGHFNFDSSGSQNNTKLELVFLPITATHNRRSEPDWGDGRDLCSAAAGLRRSIVVLGWTKYCALTLHLFKTLTAALCDEALGEAILKYDLQEIMST